MARTKVFRLFLAAVLVLALATLVAVGSHSSWVISITQESSNSLTIGVATPTESGTIMAGPCDGCSGGGGGGG